jgi:hypothetical protein
MRCWNCKHWKRHDKMRGWCTRACNIAARVLGMVWPSLIFSRAASSHSCQYHAPDMKGGH